MCFCLQSLDLIDFVKFSFFNVVHGSQDHATWRRDLEMKRLQEENNDLRLQLQQEKLNCGDMFQQLQLARDALARCQQPASFGMSSRMLFNSIIILLKVPSVYFLNVCAPDGWIFIDLQIVCLKHVML